MKKAYIRPAICEVLDSDDALVLCVSIIEPGQPNTPPGAPDFSTWGDEFLEGI